LQALGYRREERRYTPHITMGRARGERSAEPVAAAIAKQATWKGGEVIVKELRILGSELTSKGPVYTLLGRAPLLGIT
jgi:2'-5' RNA ligase